jgi:hypothetical protein
MDPLNVRPIEAPQHHTPMGAARWYDRLRRKAYEVWTWKRPGRKDVMVQVSGEVSGVALPLEVLERLVREANRELRRNLRRRFGG